MDDFHFEHNVQHIQPAVLKFQLVSMSVYGPTCAGATAIAVVPPEERSFGVEEEFVKLGLLD